MTEINRNPKMQCLVNRADESELPSQAATVFAWLSKKHAVLNYSDGRLSILCWLIMDTFHSLLPSVVWLGAVLAGMNHLVFK